MYKLDVKALLFAQDAFHKNIYKIMKEYFVLENASFHVTPHYFWHEERQ